MADRYRYSRPRSPVYNPARASLPINISGWATQEHYDHHLHAVPSGRREVIAVPGPRGSVGGLNNVTTYKIKADPPSRSSSTRDGSRTRRSTLDSTNRPPTIITSTNRPTHRPVIHSAGLRPASPQHNPYRSSNEEYYTLPARSGHSNHQKRYSATMDNADMTRLANERDNSRLRVDSGRGGVAYANTRGSRSGPIYPGSGNRPPVSLQEDYGEEGYGYTGPRDLVQYDLNNNTSRHRARRDSFESGRSGRPSSISSYNDVIPRSYDGRERGPPPSTRGFDKLPARGQTWDQNPLGRVAIAPIDPVQRPAPFEPVEPLSRSGSSRPQSMYHNIRDPARTTRNDYYEVKDDERHRSSRRQDTYDEEVEQRGFGIRADRPDRAERTERSDRDRVDRGERSQRSERIDHYDRDDDRSERKGRDAVTTGLGIGSIAGAALGLNATKNAKGDRDERNDHDDRRQKDYEDEPRRRKDRDERDLAQGGRDKERRYRDDDREPSPRDTPQSRDLREFPSPRDAFLPKESRELQPSRDNLPYRSPEGGFLDVRDVKDTAPSRERRDIDPERLRPRVDLDGTAIDSRSDTSDDVIPRHRRDSRNRRESASKPAPFNPKDTTDLKALKDALNAQDAAGPPPRPPKEPLSENRTPRGSMTRDPREVTDIRSSLEVERSSRDALQPVDNRQLRVVSPPRDKTEAKPVKGILRQPRPAFPEDPSPIREGVAPLKDAKKDGVPPDARWTKISRKLVNPEALEAGKERYEARDDFVIVLRVLSRDEVQGYAEVTQRIRSAREADEEDEREKRRRDRRERHERHKRERERNGDQPRERRRRRHRTHAHDSSSESDTTEDEYDRDNDRVRDAPPMMLEGGPSGGVKKRTAFEEPVMSGGLGGGEVPVGSQRRD